MKVVFLILFLLAHTGLYVQVEAQSSTKFSSIIQGINQDPDMQSATWGFCVKEVNSGKLIASFQPNKSLVTASVMKALTTSTAIQMLGSDYQYATDLGYEGSLSSQGVLTGNIICRGSGDPTLGSDRFSSQPSAEALIKQWGDLIRQAGITTIRGDLVADVSVFGSQSSPGNWSWEDMGNYYGAGCSGINFHENLYYLDFRSGSSPGSATQVLRTRPPVEGMTFTNEVIAGPRGSGDNAYIYGAPYSYHRYIRGSIPPAREVFTIKGSIPNPGFFIMEQLKQYLKTCGIEVQGSCRIVSAPQEYTHFVQLDRHFSPPLAEIIRETNFESINLYAEALMKTLAVQNGKEGQTGEGTKALVAYWKNRGVPTKGMILRDGSGLSPNNVATPFQISEILRLSYLSPEGKAFYAALPVAGQSGNIKSMLKGTAAQGKIRMKSGYISHVRGYAGFVESRSGKLLVFSLNANHFTCSPGRMRRLFERLMLAMANL